MDAKKRPFAAITAVGFFFLLKSKMTNFARAKNSHAKTNTVYCSLLHRYVLCNKKYVSHHVSQHEFLNVHKKMHI